MVQPTHIEYFLPVLRSVTILSKFLYIQFIIAPVTPATGWCSMDRYVTLVVTFVLMFQAALARVLGVHHIAGLLHGREVDGSELAAAAVSAKQWVQQPQSNSQLAWACLLG